MGLSTIGRSMWCTFVAHRRKLLGLVLTLAVAAVSAADVPKPSADAVLDHLNAVITWYRQVKTADSAAGQPGDVVYLDNARTLARRSLQIAFQAAEAQAPIVDALEQTAQQPSASESDASSQEARLAKAVAAADDHAHQLQVQIDALNKKIPNTPSRKRGDVVAQKEKLQADLQLANALREALHNIAMLADANDSGPPGLLGKIGEIKRSLPEASSASATSDVTADKAAPTRTAPESGGLVADASLLMTRVHQLHDAEQMSKAAAKLRDGVQQLLAPLRASIKDIIKRGNDATQQSAALTPAQVDTIRRQLNQLTTQFKQLSAAALPLHQEAMLLDQSQAALDQWRSSVHKEYGHALRNVLTQLAVILAALGVVLLLSELWRRATFRYVRDLRRRRQFTILRRSVCGVLMGMVIIGGFVREIGSLATFAGFLTAGVAVALQTVLLSVAAYFFLIGRYGVRIGDRITVSGITGDVVEIGLVRIYLLELATSGIELYPTGRVVAFSNSVLFQSTPFFKQIPGTSYTWREVVVTFLPDSDFSAAERQILEVVNAIYGGYRSNLEHQHSSIEQLFDFEISTPAPRAHLQLTSSGLEFAVRYPVEMLRASEIDEQVTRKLAEVIASTPEVKNAVSGMPQIRSAIKI